MRKIFIISVIFLSGCCFNPKLVESYKLNDFEKSIIPYDEYSELNFVNEKGDIFIASTNPKEIYVKEAPVHSESCDSKEYEEIFNTLEFTSINFEIYILLDVRLQEPSFRILIPLKESVPLENGYLSSEQLYLRGGAHSSELESYLTNISVKEFDFENIFVFEKSQEVATVELILFSTEKGVEYIEYSDGTYLKLVN